MLQRPRGVPVATVAIGGSENAAILAAEILSISDEDVHNSLQKWRQDMTDKIISDHRKG